MVSLDETRAFLARREAERRRRLDERDAGWRARLPLVARHLRALGATEVRLFGSLARGDTHEESDVDLLVAGLDPGRVAVAAATAWELTGAPVELIAREHAPQSLVEQAEHEGVAL
jgi:predicted nucleotidyltransferase